MSSSNLEIAYRDGRMWVTPQEVITMDNVRIMEDHFRAAFDAGRCDVVIDLVTTDSLFSLGIGLIMRLYNVVKESGREMRVINADVRIHRAFESMGLTRVLDIHITGTPLDIS